MESLILQEGTYGSIHKFPSGGLKLLPLMLLLGKTGTGKSPVSKLVCYLRNLPYTVQIEASRDKDAESHRVTTILNGLRREMSQFTRFVLSSASFTYISPLLPDGIEFVLNSNKGVVFPGKIESAIERLIETEKYDIGHALYIPAERTAIILGKKGIEWKWAGVFYPPVLSEHWCNALAAINDFWGQEYGLQDANIQWVRQKGIAALSGELLRKGDQWIWNSGNVGIDAKVISGGQKAGWPIVLLSTLVFSWRKSGKIPQGFAIHIEEPENGLHPDSQRKATQILAYLVNHGFYVLVTTHSLIVLYTVNNLLVASKLPRDEEGVPEPEVRLERGIARAYLFGEDGVVVDLVDQKTKLLSEAELAQVYENLAEEADAMLNLPNYPGAD